LAARPWTQAATGATITGMHTREAVAADAPAVAVIYNEGIEGRDATFETRLRTPADVEEWLSPDYPLLVAEVGEEVAGWARLAPYSDRPVYRGVAECSVYVTAARRGQGVGTRLLGALAEDAERRGFHKLLGKLFPGNAASVALVRRSGFREVGVHRCHARLDGEWRDVVLVELLLGEAAE
jgi:L-amino acid N-acyltransferase YncA